MQRLWSSEDSCRRLQTQTEVRGLSSSTRRSAQSSTQTHLAQCNDEGIEKSVLLSVVD